MQRETLETMWSTIAERKSMLVQYFDAKATFIEPGLCRRVSPAAAGGFPPTFATLEEFEHGEGGGAARGGYENTIADGTRVGPAPAAPGPIGPSVARG